MLRAFQSLWRGRIDDAEAELREAEGDMKWLAVSGELSWSVDMFRMFLEAMRGGIALGEKNILGLATQLRVAFAKDEDRTYRSVEILTPNFFLPFTTAHVLYGNNSDGSEKVLEILRPFYSTAAPWSSRRAAASTGRRSRRRGSRSRSSSATSATCSSRRSRPSSRT